MISGDDPARGVIPGLGVGNLVVVAAELALDLVRPALAKPYTPLPAVATDKPGESGLSSIEREVSILSVALALRSRLSNKLPPPILAASDNNPTLSVLSVLFALTLVPSALAIPTSAYETELTALCLVSRIRSCSDLNSSICAVALAERSRVVSRSL
jgi:hypothetical protein